MTYEEAEGNIAWLVDWLTWGGQGEELWGIPQLIEALEVAKEELLLKMEEEFQLNQSIKELGLG